jgi:hypothetical protein
MCRMLLLSFLLSTTAYASGDFIYAAVMRGCTQEDAPALEIYLGHPPSNEQALPSRPYLYIEIAWSDWDALIERDLNAAPLSRHDADPQQPLMRAALFGEKGAPMWLRGSLRLQRVSVEQKVAARFHFAEPGGKIWSGEFEARWLPSAGGCG